MEWIADHISALQDSLVYYEDILDALHSAYMAHLRVETEKMKHMVDIDVFYLTAMGVLIGIYQDVAGWLTPFLYTDLSWSSFIFSGLFSMNMAAIPNVPRYSWFFGIIGVTTFFSGIMLLFIIRWWNQSNRQPLSRLRQWCFFNKQMYFFFMVDISYFFLDCIAAVLVNHCYINVNWMVLLLH